MSIVLGIETTCDETAASIVVDGKKILSNVVFSQIETHREFGGVFPELACRKHADVLIPVIEEAIQVAGIKKTDIELISVASRPGLMGALLIGLSTAKALAYALKIPYVGVNHIEAHLYAAQMHLDNPPLPAIGLIVSGGHTSLLKMENLGAYTFLGNTLDDAVGEAFDKTARLLDLPYPGGPEIEKLAKLGDKSKVFFKPGRIKEKPFHFSFSGLKTQVLYAMKKNPNRADVAASFQETACIDLVSKSLLALEKFSLNTIYIGGGVSNNRRLREIFEEKKPSDVTIFWPEIGLSLDNAAMIAGLGYHVYKEKKCSDPFDLTPMPTNRLQF
ncbi:MAG: tRNA (adenosine(37)-N6)-threonylcarbamoyltransferase complex transferase subunit TsaD [Chlamydiae bacterium]|jgi:N6-L-threonylcarbamoyladenine synthase|nr:tRNA (adenosine(37)-N6)-threonylcarbamoyltransferase complex transferase subunit TsaD [Chlamydiota bacterium]